MTSSGFGARQGRIGTSIFGASSGGLSHSGGGYVLSSPVVAALDFVAAVATGDAAIMTATRIARRGERAEEFYFSKKVGATPQQQWWGRGRDDQRRGRNDNDDDDKRDGKTGGRPFDFSGAMLTFPK